MKFEYNAVSLWGGDPPNDDTLDNFLDSYGEDGWELVAIYDNLFIFKRQLVEEKKAEIQEVKHE